MSCGRFIPAPLTRRQMLLQSANGFGALAFAALFGESGAARAARGKDPLKPRAPHFAPKAKNVIFLYMDGGPSQVDTFDPKPRLAKENGQPIKMKVPATSFEPGTVLQSFWKFRQHGQSGIPVSDLFPHIAGCVDEMAIIRSMVSNFSDHASANIFLHTGHGQRGRPSVGSWVAYGLGSECHNLPGFIVLDGDTIPLGGLDCFHSGFLPASYQSSLFQHGDDPVADLKRAEASPRLQEKKLALLRKLDQGVLGRTGPDDKLESAIANYELAFLMQSAVPDLLDLKGETAATKSLYGLDDQNPLTKQYGQQCLLARRLVERGVRFVEVLCPFGPQPNLRWDQHFGLQHGHTLNARTVDKPIAGLLRDLKGRGLLDETIVIWGGEFGRTPMAQKDVALGAGRDHNPFGFTMWLAGGGVKGGTIHGATDDYGYYAVENKVEMYDLYATLLHLLGIDHKKLTYRFSGRDMRLTDVHGEVIKEILA